MNDMAAMKMEGAGRVRRAGAAVSARRRVGVRELLEWAFGTECARLDYDEVAAVAGHGLPGRGAEARLLESRLLGCDVDTSRGRSLPHDDAEQVATVVRNVLPWHLAIHVASLARAGAAPDWMPEARVRCVPVAWKRANQYGAEAQTEEIARIKVRTRRGLVQRALLVCPVTYTPTAAQVGAARRAYLDWWGALLDVGAGLRGHEFRRFVLTDDMPPLRPWQEIR